ncbi:MAG: HIT domain-containing protein [Desulfurococcales archaeon]|nr:HIT domain-containing protein [Desulfurococcales archaeon]MEB3778856.1 HIT domain-containing protein [Desulfurococcales archaeon]
MRECIFCQILRGEAEGYYIYRGEDIAVILDKYPVSKGHLLVLTEKHYESVHDADPRDTVKAWAVASALASIYRRELGANGVNLVANSGKPAGQVVFHFHIHVIPRWSREYQGFWSGRHVLTKDEAKEVIDSLKPHVKYIEEYLERAGLRE